MGLIVDPLSPHANCYVSLAEATLILGARPYTSAWDALGTTPSAMGWLVDGAHSAGATTVAIKDGTGSFEVDTVVEFEFAGVYYSVTAVGAGTIDISPALAAPLADNNVVVRRTYNEKEQFLLYARQRIDAEIRWRGTKWDMDQPLDWPRTGVHDCEGHLYCFDCFPQDLKVLNAVYANDLAQRDTSKPPDLLGLGISRARVDVIEVQVDPTQVLPTMPPATRDLIGCMGSWQATQPGSSRTVALRRT